MFWWMRGPVKFTKYYSFSILITICQFKDERYHYHYKSQIYKNKHLILTYVLQSENVTML